MTAKFYYFIIFFLKISRKTKRNETPTKRDKKGADVNATNRHLMTPIHYAAGRGDFKLLKMFIDSRKDSGKSIGKKSKKKNRKKTGKKSGKKSGKPTRGRMRCDKLSAIYFFIFKIVNLNCHDDLGNTPLQLSVMKTKSPDAKAVTQLLIDNKADINAVDKKSLNVKRTICSILI